MARRAPAVLSEIAQFMVFRLGERRYALPLAVVEQVVRAVEVTPLSKAPPIVLGRDSIRRRKPIGRSLIQVPRLCRQLKRPVRVP
jgi:chemotaxis signal transduction protein